MQHEATSLVGDEEIGITFTDKAVTPWGGLVLFSGLARQVGLEDALRKALPFQLTSPNATDPVEVVLAFMAGVLVGSLLRQTEESAILSRLDELKHWVLSGRRQEFVRRESTEDFKNLAHNRLLAGKIVKKITAKRARHR